MPPTTHRAAGHGGLSKGRVSVWMMLSLGWVTISIILVIFAHAYPYWLQAESSRDTLIPNVGLWEICFPEEGAPAPMAAEDTLGLRFYGCNYLFDRDLRKIRDWFYPDWFLCVVVFVSLSLLLQPLSIILNILYFVRVCSAHNEHILVLVSCVMNFLDGILIAIAIIVFGFKSCSGNEWIPLPNSNHLSWSFAICAFAPIFCFLAATFQFIDFMRIKFYRDRNAKARVYARGEFARY